MTGPAVDGDPCIQLSPLKLLCGAKGGEDNPDESRPKKKTTNFQVDKFNFPLFQRFFYMLRFISN